MQEMAARVALLLLALPLTAEHVERRAQVALSRSTASSAQLSLPGFSLGAASAWPCCGREQGSTEHGGLRVQGSDKLLQVLAGEGKAWSAADRAAYLEAARPHMTAAEQVWLRSLLTGNDNASDTPTVSVQL